MKILLSGHLSAPLLTFSTYKNVMENSIKIRYIKLTQEFNCGLDSLVRDSVTLSIVYSDYTGPDFDSRQRQKTFSFASASRSALGPT